MAAASSIKRSSKGKQKIEIKPIDNYNARQVCFSKRRNGIFKKANELSILCGAQIAIIAFSPGGRPFSFGHPSVEAIIDRFITGAAAGVGPPTPPSEAGMLTAKVEEVKKRKVEVEAALRATSGAVDLEGLEVEQLERMEAALQWL